MTEKNLIDIAAIETKYDRKLVRAVLNSIIKEIKYKVELDHQVTIKNFGTFALRKRTDGTFKPGFTPAKTWIETKKNLEVNSKC